MYIQMNQCGLYITVVLKEGRLTSTNHGVISKEGGFIDFLGTELQQKRADALKYLGLVFPKLCK